jgi:hypothetical protein
MVQTIFFPDIRKKVLPRLPTTECYEENLENKKAEKALQS